MNQSAIFFSYAGFNSIPFLQIEIFSLFQFQKKIVCFVFKSPFSVFQWEEKENEGNDRKSWKIFHFDTGPIRFQTQRFEKPNHDENENFWNAFRRISKPNESAAVASPRPPEQQQQQQPAMTVSVPGRPGPPRPPTATGTDAHPWGDGSLRRPPFN